jgi:hypothetical protein
MVMQRNVLGRQRTELFHKNGEVNVLEKYVLHLKVLFDFMGNNFSMVLIPI